MKKNINNQNNLIFNMKKILMLIGLILISILSVNAVAQNNIVYYPVETATGTILFDTSGNNYNSVLLNGVTFVSTNSNKFGTYNLQCDGSNDYVSGSSLFPINSNSYSVSFWIRTLTGNNKDAYIQFQSSQEYMEVYYDWTTNTLNLEYMDSSGNIVTTTLDNLVLVNNAWYHIVVIIDKENQRYSYYRDNNLIASNNLFIGGYKYNNTELKTITMCNENPLVANNYYGGRLDSIRLLNFKLNATQVNTLFTNDLITFETEPIITNDSINQTPLTYVNSNIINFTTPINNEVVTKFNNIVIATNNLAYCDLYIDNNLMYQTTQKVFSFTYPLMETSLGEHNYLTYCHYTLNNVEYYDLSETINFNLTAPVKTINFNVYNTDKTLNTGQDLYLATPCPMDKELSQYWILERPFYVQKLVNGNANYDLSYNADYEFCLLKGRVNYDVDTYTQNINFVGVTKVTSLGTLYVTNDTLNYNLGLTNADLYDPVEPEFWGKTWETLFTLIVALILGGLFIYIGIRVDSKVLVYIGGVIIAGGLGISVGNFIFGGLF